MSFRRLTIATLTCVALLPLHPDSAESKAQCSTLPSALPMPGTYPDHTLSPYESLKHHEVVFLGEVVVPSRKCSLGFCAGIKVIKTVKGRPPEGNLIQVTKPGETECPPAYFGVKGSRWVVFANQGTSKTGLLYLYAEDLGPSFQTQGMPDFSMLEVRYRALRAALDQALEEHLR
jgi:hypothetical protein